jgi:hypothetical protein
LRQNHIVKIIRPVDRHDVDKRRLAVSPDLHQPHNPNHASTPGQTTDAKIPLWPSHPQTCGGPQETRDKLRGVSTATLASALYKRGLRNQMVQDVRPLGAPKGGSMVGEAYTLRYMPAREDLNPMTVFRNHNHPQRKAVEECPPGAVLVMDSRKDPARRRPAASW